MSCETSAKEILRALSNVQALTNKSQYCICSLERTGLSATRVQLRHWSAENPAKPDDIFEGNLPTLLGAL